MDELTKKFENIFNDMEFNETINVTLNVHEISDILSSLKAADSYINAMDEQIKKVFAKARF